MGLTPRQKALKPSIRRLSKERWSADAIARLYDLTRSEVRAILAAPVRPPSPVGPARPIWAQTATKVRRLAFEEGKDAEAIAAILDLCPVKVADFLARLTPRQAHHRRRGPTINRPRSRREQEALREWAPNRAGDERDLVMLPADEVLDLVEVPELLGAPPPAIAEPNVWDDGPLSPKIGKVDGTPVRRGKARRKPVKRRPDSDPRRKLDAAAREEILRLHAQGWGFRRLAKKFGVNQKSIRKLIRTSPPRPRLVPPPPVVTIGMREPAPEPETRPKRLGPAPSNAKLTDPAVRAEIRELSRQGWGIRRLGARFNVSHSSIRRLLLGLSFADDPGAPPPPPAKEKAQPGGWREPDGSNRGRLGRDVERARDLVMLPPPAAPPPPPAIPEPVPWEGGPRSPDGRCARRKLDGQAEAIGDMLRAGLSVEAIGRRLGVAAKTVMAALIRAEAEGD
jgi:transposase-like protein